MHQMLLYSRTRGQHVVDEDQEAFVRNLGVGVEEHGPDVLHSHLDVQRRDVALEHTGDGPLQNGGNIYLYIYIHVQSFSDPTTFFLHYFKINEICSIIVCDLYDIQTA